MDSFLLLRTNKRRRERFEPPKNNTQQRHADTSSATKHTSTMGEESRTKKTRTKRPNQPNSKQLKEKVKKIKAERKPGITFAQKKKQKKEEDAKKKGGKYNTEFGKEGMVLKNKGAKLGPMEIRYRALAKLLRQIEQLEEKEKLDAQQTKKVKRKAFIEEEMRQLIKAAKGEDEDDDDDDDDNDDDDKGDLKVMILSRSNSVLNYATRDTSRQQV